MIFEVFLYLDDTIDNMIDNVQEVEKDNEVCRDLFRFWLFFFILTLSIPGFGRGWFSQGGALSAPPLEINEGVSGEQDSLNTIFNTHKIRIVCKIWSSYYIVHARARSF